MKLLTTGDIAAKVGVHKETVRRWIRSGALPCIRPTLRTIRVRSDLVEEFLRLNGLAPKNTHATSTHTDTTSSR